MGDCFIYNNSSWRLNYCVGGEVRTTPLPKRACFEPTCFASARQDIDAENLDPDTDDLSCWPIPVAQHDTDASSYPDSQPCFDLVWGNKFCNSPFTLILAQVTTMFHLDRPMYLLGYLASQSRIYLIDKARPLRSSARYSMSLAQLLLSRCMGSSSGRCRRNISLSADCLALAGSTTVLAMRLA